MDYHPAFESHGRAFIEEPLGRLEDDASGHLPFGGVPLLPIDELRSLREQVASEYVRQLEHKLTELLGYCRVWGVQVVAFPEYSIPAVCLPTLADRAGDLIVVAGSHRVSRASIESGVYKELGLETPPQLRTAVSPVLHKGQAIAMVPKCRPSPIAGEADDLEPGTGWHPVTLPDGLVGPMGVRICIDFVASEPPSSGQGHEQVRFWIVPSPTPSVEDFHTEARKQATRLKRPVVYVNSAARGETCIITDSRHQPEALLPLALQPGEEGVIVADICFQDRGPGRSTGFHEPRVIRPVAAASLVYTAKATDAAYAKWLEQLGTLVEAETDPLEQFRAIEVHAKSVQGLRPQAPPTCRQRLNDLLYRAPTLDNLDDVRQLTREVVLPASVLPMDAIRGALAQGAADVLRVWIERDPAHTRELATIEARLGHEGALIHHKWEQRWVPEARQSLDALADAVRDGAPTRHRTSELIDRLTFYAGEIAQGFEDGFAAAKLAFDAERFDDALDHFSAMLAQAQATLEADPGNRTVQSWAARLRLMKAMTLLNLQDRGAATEEVRQVDRHVLAPEQYRDLVVLLAETGELDDARTLLDTARSLDLDDGVRQRLAEAEQRVALIEGTLPPDLLDDPMLYVKAAQLEARRSHLVEAIDYARRAIEDTKPVPRLTLGIVLTVVVGILEHDVFELGPPPRLSSAQRAEVIEMIEACLAEIGGASLPSAISERIHEVIRRYFEIVQDLIRRESVPGKENNDPRSDHALGLAREGRAEEALQELESRPSTGSRWLDALRRIGILVIGNREDEAIEELVRLAKAFPGRAPIEFELGELELRRGNTAAALAHAQLACDALPGSGYRYLLAQCLAVEGQWEHAWQTLVPERDRANWRTLKLLAQLADRIRPSEARLLWDRYVEVQPRDFHAKLQRAVTVRLAGNHDEAAQLAWSVYEEHQDELSAEAIYQCARLQETGEVLSIDAKQRMRDASLLLHRRFAADPNAHAFRLELRMMIGYEEGEPPVDFHLLQGAGIAQRFSPHDLPKLISSWKEESEARAQLYHTAGIPLGELARAEQCSVSSSLLRILETPDERFCGYVAWMDSAIDPITPPEVLLGDAELLLAMALGLRDPLVKAARRQALSLVIPSEAATCIADEMLSHRSGSDESRKAIALATQATDFIRKGQEEGWLRVATWPELYANSSRPPPEFPDLTGSPTNEIIEALIRRPFEVNLRYAASVLDRSERHRVTIDHYAVYGITHSVISRMLRWPNPRAFHDVVEILLDAGRSTMSFPDLVRLLTRRNVLPESERRHVLETLAHKGFPDAIAPTELVECARQDATLSNYVDLLTGLESIARNVASSTGAPARIRLAGTYARAIAEAFLPRASDPGATCLSIDLSASTPRDEPRPRPSPLPTAEAEVFLRALLERLESLDGSRGTLLEDTLTLLAIEATENSHAALVPTADSPGYVSTSDETPMATMWMKLYGWAGRDGRRRPALERAVRRAWCLAESFHDGEPLPTHCASLIYSNSNSLDETMQGGSEALAILSANWSYKPLKVRVLEISDPESGPIRISYEQFLEHAAHVLTATKDDDLLAIDDRRARVRRHFPGGVLSVNVPLEAALLRARPHELRPRVESLLANQGAFDRRTYDLLAQLLERPDDRRLRRAYARHAATALWRLVRDDPSYLTRWADHLSLTDAEGVRPSSSSLAALLHEPPEPIGKGIEPHTLLEARLEQHWADLHPNVRSVLFGHVTQCPGTLAIQSVPIRLADEDYTDYVEHALQRLAHSTQYPAGIVASDIMFLRVATVRQPLIDLPGGPVDLRERLPELLETVLHREVQLPAPGSFAAHEHQLLITVASVCHRLLDASRGLDDLLWLTYRLHAWLFSQLSTLGESARIAGIARLVASNDRETIRVWPSASDDLFNPLSFTSRDFEYRRMMVLFALAAMEDLAHHPELAAETSEPPAEVTSPGLEGQLLLLASGPPTEQPYLSSWFDWQAPDTVPDLALDTLLRLNADRILDLAPATLVRRIEGWPHTFDDMAEPRQVLVQRLLGSLCFHGQRLDPSVRRALEDKLQSLQTGAFEQRLAWLGLTGLFATGTYHLEPSVCGLVEQRLAEPAAPTVTSLYLQGIGSQDPSRLDPEVTRLYEYWHADRDRAIEVLTKAVSRLVIHAEGGLQQAAETLLRDLVSRPGFRDDPGLQERVKRLRLEEPPP